MSVVLDILKSYRAPRSVVRRRVGETQREDRALAILLAACVLIFVAQWPRLSREAFLDQTTPLDMRMAGALFGWLLLAPLALYVTAIGVQGAARMFGVPISGYQARVSLFWALLAASPLWLLSGLIAGFLGPSTVTSIVGFVALASFLGIWVAGLVEIADQARKAKMES